MPFLAIMLLLMGLGCTGGLLLHWLLPEIDLGTAVLTGVVVTGLTIHFFTRFMAAMEAYDASENEVGPPFTVFALQPPRTTKR